MVDQKSVLFRKADSTNLVIDSGKTLILSRNLVRTSTLLFEDMAFKMIARTLEKSVSLRIAYIIGY